MGLSVAAHLGALFLPSKLIPPRNDESKIELEYRVLYGRPLDVLRGGIQYLAWVSSIGLAAMLFVGGQPFWDLSSSAGAQSWLPLFLGMFGAHFPASVLVAKDQTLPDRGETD